MRWFLVAIVGTLLLMSCEKGPSIIKVEKEYGSISFLYDVVQQKSSRSIDLSLKQRVSQMLLTIADENDSLHYDHTPIDLINFNGEFISKTVPLLTKHTYKVIHFALMDSLSEILYATPYSSSKLSSLVERPLSLAFALDGVDPIVLQPSVIPIEGQEPADFGLLTFNTTILSPNAFYIAAFAADSIGIHDFCEAELVLTHHYDTLLTSDLEKGINLLSFDPTSDTMTLSINSGDLTVYRERFTEESLKEHFQKPLAVTLTPQKEQITFHSDRDGNYEIYCMNPDGSNQTRLTADNSVDETPRWSPDRSIVVFTSSRSGNRDIYLMDANGTYPVQVTRDNGDDYSPGFSPDGSHILFTSNRTGIEKVYAINLNGKDERLVSKTKKGMFSPRYSPDGRTILYSRKVKRQSELFRMNHKGKQKRMLTYKSYKDCHQPNWSPTGSLISFASTNNGDGSHIYLMNSNGGWKRIITGKYGVDSKREEFYSTWSKDGTELVVSSTPTGGKSELWIVNTDGTEMRPIIGATGFNNGAPHWR